MKILLVYPHSQSVYGLPRYPALGIAYLATVLKEKGFAVEILDLRLPQYDFQYLAKKLTQFKPGLVGVGSTSYDFPGALAVFKTVKRLLPKTVTLLGGPHASVCPNKAIKEKSLDYLLMGEGEVELPRILKALAKKQSLEKIRGLVHRGRGGKPVITSSPELIKDLNALPFPQWDLFPLDEYRARGKLTLPLATSRGCPYGCIYCVSWRTHGKRFRFRSPQNVVDEIEQDVKKYGAERISFVDDNLTLDKERALKICQEIIRRKLKISWTCDQGIRADNLDKRLLKAMKKSGCRLIAIGVESGDEEVLRRMNKGERLATMRKAIADTKAAGLIVKAFFIVGSPGDNFKNTKKSIQFFKETDVDIPRFGMMTAYPGSLLWEWVEKNGRWLGDPYKHILDTPTTFRGVQFETPDFSKEERLAAFALAEKEAEIWSIRQRLRKMFGPLLGCLLLPPFYLSFFRELVKKTYRLRLFSVTD